MTTTRRTRIKPVTDTAAETAFTKTQRKERKKSPETTPFQKSKILDLKRAPAALPFLDLWKTLAPFVRAICYGKALRPQEVDDVCEAVQNDLFTQLYRYEADKGKFHAWLGKITHNKVSDVLRKRIPYEKHVTSYGSDPDILLQKKARSPKAENTSRTTTEIKKHKEENKPAVKPVSDSAIARLHGKLNKSAGPATLVCIKEEREIARSVLERVVARVSARQYQIFDAYVLREWDVDKVCKTLGITPNTVFIARFRVGKVYNAELTAEGKRLGRDLDLYRAQVQEPQKTAAKKTTKRVK